MTPLDCALEYASAGLCCFPAYVNPKGAKVPLIEGWPSLASTDPAQLAAWWGEWPGAMVGLGHKLTGTMALDIDRHREPSGWESMMRHRMAGHDDPLTLAYRTSSGGAQRIYARPVDLAALGGNYAGALGAGLDIILGYSMLPSGTATPGREWVNGPADTMPCGAPNWIADVARARADKAMALASLPTAPALPMPAPRTIADLSSLRYCAAVVDGECEAIRALPDGERQNGLHKAACNVGRALARQGRVDLLAWAGDALARSAPWAAARHEQATIERGLAWGIQHGSDAS